MPRLPSAFSKSMGFTLCGIVDEPFTGHRALAQVPERNITPHIPTQVDEHDIDCGHGVAVLVQSSRALDLRRVGIHCSSKTR